MITKKYKFYFQLRSGIIFYYISDDLIIEDDYGYVSTKVAVILHPFKMTAYGFEFKDDDVICSWLDKGL